MSDDDDSPLSYTARVIEAVLFGAGRPVDKRYLVAVLKLPRGMFDEAVAVLKARLEQSSALFVIDRPNTLQLASRPEYGTYIGMILKSDVPVQNKAVSEAALEVLSYIAYFQPCTKRAVDEARYIDSEKTLSWLKDNGFIETYGDSGQGSESYYGTTEVFLVHFGLKSLSDLPPLDIDPAKGMVAAKLSA